ncbi:hypothetical protein OEZ85_010445 [Tetradesmus obliquus]|uniref:EFHB C-terminal EF-hand domain-containing protein n=1 Tax=Tetradesmus obliquus TaxID=3088 RepID=A0ABY8TMM1_TETOB|nr:hypothetical protein OEZ85_010445 [Tetradesmus obliquus]
MFSSSLYSSLGRAEYQSTETLKQLRPAGVTSSVVETAKDALTWQERPPTPEVQKPFQHYARQPAGAIMRHFGTARDVVRDGPFGCKTRAGVESAAECLEAYPGSEIGRWQLQQREEVYASTHKEPLGCTISRGYQMPAGLGTEVPFGRPLHVKEQEAQNSTQTIIFPQQAADDDDNTPVHSMYVSSHGSFAPGEQRKRDYDWSKAKIDPRQHRFGRVDSKGQQSSMKQILQPDLDQLAAAKQAAVVSSVYDRHKATLGDELGKPRLLGAGNRALPPDHVFGKCSAREAEPCVGELMRGYYSAEEQAPDPDLGKSLREGWRNTEASGRTFGVPSVRNDIPLPPSRSVASTKNYGNEPSAGQLLAPPKCVDLGVKEEHLLQLRSPDELAQLLADAGLALGQQEFEEVLAQAEGVRDEQQQLWCSLDAFMAARRSWLQQQAGLA